MRIEKLRKFAEMDLCKDCFEKYKRLIEPSIKKLRSTPLEGWPETEANLTAIIWKEKKYIPHGKK